MTTKTYRVHVEVTRRYAASLAVEVPADMPWRTVRKRLRRMASEHDLPLDEGEVSIVINEPSAIGELREPDVYLDDDGEHVCKPVDLSTVPDEAWFEWGGHRWASNGHIAVREDGPRGPGRIKGSRSDWRDARQIPPEGLRDVMAALPHARAATVTHAWEADNCDRPARIYEAGDALGPVDGLYAPVLDGLDVRLGEGATFFGLRDGECVAVVMGLNPKMTEIRPTGGTDRA